MYFKSSIVRGVTPQQPRRVAWGWWGAINTVAAASYSDTTLSVVGADGHPAGTADDTKYRKMETPKTSRDDQSCGLDAQHARNGL